MRGQSTTSLHIKIARTTLGLSQRDLAKAAKCCNERISQIERGSRPSAALLIRITAALSNTARKAGSK